MTWAETYRRLVTSQLKATLDPLEAPVYALCRYHLGWIDEAGRPLPGQSGKMLRPLLCLAGCRAYGPVERAIGIAAALELLHVFSLAHDDIEDGDQERRHRPTLWALHGVPLALNAGDALYALSIAVLHQGTAPLPHDTANRAHEIFSSACLALVEGQHLDLEFEARAVVTLDEYLVMAKGKTGALIAASLALGALCGGAPAGDVDQLLTAGVDLGLAFQARDDALSFWGDPAQTGKAAGNDLARGKKSLPVVLARTHGAATAQGGGLDVALADLDRAGTRAEIEDFVAGHAGGARRAISALDMKAEGRTQLLTLVELAVSRES